jgi:quinoprotein glucose dehydrogenase
MIFYTGDAFPAWRDHLLIGTLFHQHVGVFRADGGQITPVARLLDRDGHRIRDLAQGPEGLIYVLTDGGGGQVLRLSPR